jgi:hypothetical protein
MLEVKLRKLIHLLLVQLLAIIILFLQPQILDPLQFFQLRVQVKIGPIRLLICLGLLLPENGLVDAALLFGTLAFHVARKLIVPVLYLRVRQDLVRIIDRLKLQVRLLVQSSNWIMHHLLLAVR